MMVFYLGGDGEYKILSTWSRYEARFMADALFILTLVMTDNVVHVRKLEEKAKIKQEDFFVSGCNAPWFLRSYIVVKATRSFKTSHCIADEFPTLRAALIKSMKSHFGI